MKTRSNSTPTDTARSTPLKRVTTPSNKPRAGVRKLKITGMPAQFAQEPKIVEFQLEAPTAESVKLAGDFTNWQQSPLELKRSTQEVWTVHVSLKPGNYAYRFIVDEQWCDDPKSTRWTPNPFGSTNAIIEVV